MLSDHGFARAAVLGAGLMGRRIAGVLACGGLAVALHDTRTAILESAARSARELARDNGTVTISADLQAAVREADLVVEAIVEDLPAKQELFGRLDQLAPSAAVLATNTSVLPVGLVTARVRQGGRCVGTHWWNPPDLIPVVEVVRAERTAPATSDRVESLLRDLGKTPVLVRKDVPGFIGNRLQHALWRESIALVADGICDAATADLVARNTIGLRLACLGPIENADYVGLDLTLAIHRAVLPSLNRDQEPNALLCRLVAQGDLGAKTGRGFLDWPPHAQQEVTDRLAAHLSGQLAPHARPS